MTTAAAVTEASLILIYLALVAQTTRRVSRSLSDSGRNW